MYEYVLRQRVDSNKAAAQPDDRGNRPPELRLGKISSDGRIRLEFPNSISFPSKEEFVDINHKSNNELIDLVVYKGDEELLNDNLIGWEIVSVSSKLIEIDLNFEKPLLVSHGEAYDKLIIQARLN